MKTAQKQEVKRVKTKITFSKRRDPWIFLLANFIGCNYCCKAFSSHVIKKQTHWVGFIGLSEDADICVTIFEYAVDCVFSEIKRIKEANKGLSAADVKSLCNGYGYGFALGVAEAFENQQKEHEESWGLVLTMPKEVIEASNSFKSVPLYCPEKISGVQYNRGLSHGRNFKPDRRLS